MSFESNLVSVVVPVYNVEKYLDKCLGSIVGQTYKNIEIILVDDGSPDNCPQMCDEWAEKDSRIKVIHKKNAGLGMARNTGIDNSNGQYICFIDSDDSIAANTIEKCVDAALKKNVDAVLFGMVDVNSKNEYLQDVDFSICKLVYEGKQVVEELLPEIIAHDFSSGPAHNFAFSACTALFKLSVIKDNNLSFLSEREIISEDSYFLLELYSKLNAVALIPEALYFRFNNNFSLTKTYRSDRQQKNTFFYERALELAENLRYSNQLKNRISVLYQNFTIAALKQTMASSINAKLKLKTIKEVLKASLLRSTFTVEILKLQKPLLKLFYSLARLRLYCFCYLMLWFKVR